MKIILSRKGFDSDFGGIPSPIFPDNSFCSFPIPTRDNPSELRYSDIKFRDWTLGELLSDLSKGKILPNDGAHLDPDLYEASVPRVRGWLPAFGQVGQAQSHLENNSVAVGDLFLFFGWFRKVSENNGNFEYESYSKWMHMMFGWLQIGDIIKPSEIIDVPIWLRKHPHISTPNDEWKENTVYIASESLQLSNLDGKFAGGGLFPKYSNKLQLTNPESNNRSCWRLPKWFYPDKGRKPLSYHSKMSRWNLEGKYAVLNSVGRGQEFILDTKDYPESLRWLKSLFKCIA